MHIAARNAKDLQAGYLVTSGTRTTYALLHTFLYKHVCSCFLQTFYDAKLQLVKPPPPWANQVQYHQITHANIHYYY